VIPVSFEEHPRIVDLLHDTRHLDVFAGFTRHLVMPYARSSCLDSSSGCSMSTDHVVKRL
jgi:hypothetical protein